MARWTASAKWAAGPALDGQRDMPLALRLSEGLGLSGPLDDLKLIACWVLHGYEDATPKLFFRQSSEMDSKSFEFSVFLIYVLNSEGKAGEAAHKHLIFRWCVVWYCFDYKFSVARVEYTVSVRASVRL